MFSDLVIRVLCILVYWIDLGVRGGGVGWG